MTSRLLDDLVGLTNALGRGCGTPPERPTPPREDLRDLPGAPGSPRMPETALPGSLRLVGPAQPGEEVAGEPGGPGHPLVVADPCQLALGLANIDERLAHPRGPVVLDPHLQLEQPRPVEAARVTGLLRGSKELLQGIVCGGELARCEEHPRRLKQCVAMSRAADLSEGDAARRQALDCRKVAALEGALRGGEQPLGRARGKGASCIVQRA